MGNKPKVLRTGFLLSGRKPEPAQRFSCPQVELRTQCNKSASRARSGVVAGRLAMAVAVTELSLCPQVS